MKRLSPKTKFRVSFLMICVIISLSFFVYTLFSNLTEIISNVSESKSLNEKYATSLEDEEELKDEINKLQDPEYLARYAREKYLYSAKNEIIIKIEE